MKTTLTKLTQILSTAIALTTLLTLASATVAAAAATTASIDSNAGTQAFQVKVSGQGKPMILIPGLASSGEVWNDTVAHYSSQYRCAVLTLAGFAGAPAISGPYLQQVEDALARYISDNKLDHPVIVGHSLGGFLAMKLASDYPDKVGKVVIVDALPALGAQQMPSVTAVQLEEMARTVRDRMLQSDPAQQNARRRATIATMVSKPEDIERIAVWGDKSDSNTVANAMYELLAQDMRQDISKIAAPTLVMGTWIAYKEYVPRTTIESVFKTQFAKLPNAKITLADHARHFIMVDDPGWMFEQMDSFLK
ncbi:alpha/beta hydrolase [Undibacterium sp. Jales W-56]|uniref:alpha/beta fold hydrolase n=1 Tax=Undibacterium sp. Jales W-56 TaxID=2897325 RepID=UPI0021CFB473|nr:alpha/beta hydrolase [Undibacterium sp. Jales W-56]MCU6434216.1 alpha/beta hydrolase [Undibacterium sp. Jales W-56]